MSETSYARLPATSDTASVSTTFICANHSIRRIHAKGSNDHVRREYGECVYCGAAFRRVIRWDTSDARSWWEAIS